MRDFRELEIWKSSHELVLRVYKKTTEFPDEEKYGLTNQLRRSSTSIPSNIAEGCGRNTNKELIHFCHIALGSAYEIDYQLLLAKDLTFIKKEDYEVLFEKLTILKKEN